MVRFSRLLMISFRSVCWKVVEMPLLKSSQNTRLYTSTKTLCLFFLLPQKTHRPQHFKVLDAGSVGQTFRTKSLECRLLFFFVSPFQFVFLFLLSLLHMRRRYKQHSMASVNRKHRKKKRTGPQVGKTKRKKKKKNENKGRGQSV